MNQGARLDEILHEVRAPRRPRRPSVPPPDLRRARVRRAQRLAALRRLVRRQPRHLKPARETALAAELAALAGGAARLAARATELAATGTEEGLRLAGHLVELAVLAAGDEPAIHAARAEVFRLRVATATSTMAKGVFAWAQAESARKAGSTRDGPAH